MIIKTGEQSVGGLMKIYLNDQVYKVTLPQFQEKQVINTILSVIILVIVGLDLYATKLILSDFHILKSIFIIIFQICMLGGLFMLWRVIRDD